MNGLWTLLFFAIFLVWTGHTQSYDDLWQYPGYYWQTAYANSDSYWLSFYADNCTYIRNKWYNSPNTFFYDYSESSVTCYEQLNNDFTNAISQCEADSSCYAMLLQIYYEDHENNLEHWGDHVAYLYSQSASSFGQNLTIANWTLDSSNEISTTYVEKNEQEPLLVNCHFVTFSVDCNNWDANYLMIPTTYYETYYDNYGWNDSSIYSISNYLSDKEYIYQKCDSSLASSTSIYSSGIHYCMKSREYTLIGKGSKDDDYDDIEMTLYVSQYGNNLLYWELYANDTKTAIINITDSDTLADDDDCDLYQQTSYFSWIGDGTCDGELNKYPCYDGGDCCNSTCIAHEDSDLRICGERGYHCIDPNATEYYNYLNEYSMKFFLQINPDTSFDMTIDVNNYSTHSDLTDPGYYVTVIDHTSGVITDNKWYDSTDEVKCSAYIEFEIPYNHFVIVYGYGGDESDMDMLEKTALDAIGVLMTSSQYDAWLNLRGVSFIFTGRKGAEASVQDNSYIDYIDDWKSFTYDFDSWFQWVLAYSTEIVNINTTFWMDEECPTELSYRYYILDNIGRSNFEITAELYYFDNDYACSSSLTNDPDIYGKIAVTRDWDTCNTSLKIANAQLYGAEAIIIINRRNDGIPNIIWYDSDTRDTLIDDITIPVLAIGFTDGEKLYESLFTEANTWRSGNKIYNYPNYTIVNSRLCASPEGIYELATCDNDEIYEYDNCTTLICQDSQWIAELDTCLNSRQYSCSTCYERIYSGDNNCCGECIEIVSNDELDECYNDDNDNQSSESYDGYDFFKQYTLFHVIAMILFAILGAFILISISIVYMGQRKQYQRQIEHALSEPNPDVLR